MTDWFGVADTVASAEAGLDLEMPGPARAYGAALATAVDDGRVPVERLDAIVDALAARHRPAGRMGRSPAGRGVDRPAGAPRRRAKRAASDACVLLANDGLLPLDDGDDLRVALIGPRVDRVHMMGGGSAQLVPHHRTSLLDVIAARLGDRLTFEPGDRIDQSTPEIAGSELRAPDGDAGVLVDLWNGPAIDGEPDAAHPPPGHAHPARGIARARRR